MGSHLGPALANMFLSEVFDPIARSHAKKFFRYVDDTLLLAKSESVPDICGALNRIHPNIRVTSEVPTGGKLPFLDIEITPSGTTVYRKPSSTEVVANYHSACPWSYKAAGVISSVRRALETCKDTATLHTEINRIRQIYRRNQWPSGELNRLIDRATNAYNQSAPKPDSSAAKRLVLPYLGSNSDGLRRRLIATGNYSAVFTTPKLRAVCNNRHRPKNSDTASNVVYELTCSSCSGRYVGHTGQQLLRRLNQHRADDNSAMNTHGCDRPQMTHRIIYRHIHHYIAEAIFIRETTPTLNRRDEKTFTLLLS